MLKHLRSFGKKEFWSSVRNIFRSEEKVNIFHSLLIDPEELKRNKEQYETELRASLNAEPDNRLPYIVATRTDDGIKEISESTLEAIGGVKIAPDVMEERLRVANKLSENGVQPLTKFKPHFPLPFDKLSDKPNPFLMSCPEPNQVNPISNEEVTEIFNVIRSRMDELNGNIIPSTPTFKSDKVSVAITIKELREEHKNDNLPKVITINVSGIVGIGKTYILAKIEEMLKNDLSATVISSALDDEEKQYGLRKADLAQHHLDMFRDGKIVFNLTETHIRDDGKPFGSPIDESKSFPNLHCPCCD